MESKLSNLDSNREQQPLSLGLETEWLRFNERVLIEAEESENPLLERLKFYIIFGTNLDEFFMVRLSSLIRTLDRAEKGELAMGSRLIDQAVETYDEVAEVVARLLERCATLFHRTLLPELTRNGIHLVRYDETSPAEKRFLDEFFLERVFPVLTPLAVDPAHPFPYLANLSLYLVVSFEGQDANGDTLLGFVEVPRTLQRLITLPSSAEKHRFMFLEELMKAHLERLFPWTQVVDSYVFRVTRNLDYQLLESAVKDLMKSIEGELKDREQKIPVRMEHEAGLPDTVRERLRTSLELDVSDVYEVRSPLNSADLWSLTKIEGKHELRDPVHTPKIPPRLQTDGDIFSILRHGDLLLHHPYDSFKPVIDFLEQAAEDRDVLAIKQTLYRAGWDSPIIDILGRAAENGKQVTVVVELKARFDEKTNIKWAKRLEQAGAHVVFGFVGLKTHAKCALVIRKEGNKLKKYAHLSTGNYNSTTARLYTDLAMISANNTITEDVADLFNLLTGFNIVQEKDPRKMARKPVFRKVFVAPFHLRKSITQLIRDETERHRKNGNGRIIMKMNSLVDEDLIQALYDASEQGVEIDLIVRGMCSLRPGVEGMSKNIRVRSIVDRFLEHSRIFSFGSGNDLRMFLSSADFMERNMDRRIEICWPVESPELIEELRAILDIHLSDNCKCHIKHPDGTYARLDKRPGAKRLRSQQCLIERAGQKQRRAAQKRSKTSANPKQRTKS